MERGVKFRHIVYNLDETKDEIELDPYLKKNPKFQVSYLLNFPLAATCRLTRKK